MSESYQWDFGSVESGLQFTVVFDGDSFTVTCVSGYLDLNALWFSDGDKSVEGTVTLTKSDNSLNLNGTGITWDDYYKVSSTGLGSAGEDKASFLTEGESMSFPLDTLGLPSAITSLLGSDPKALIIGVRVTSSSSLTGDGKYVDISGEKLLAEAINRAPVLDTVSNGVVTDSATDDNYSPVNGTLSGSDPDGDAVTFELADSTGTGEAGFNVQKSTTYGTFYLNTASGAYKFVADDAAVEALKDTVTLNFVVNATDGVADSATQTLSIALNGVNDTPELDAVSDGAVNDSASDDDFDDVIGTLTGRDRDDTVSFELADSTGTGETGFNVHKSTAYGTFYLNTATGAYKFVADDAAVEALKDTVTLDFVVNATDGVADSATQTLSIALNGVNDTPELDAVSDGAVNDSASDDDFDDLIGTLTGRDRDDTVSFELADSTGTGETGFNVQKSTAYGTFYLNTATGAYKFVADDAAVEALKDTVTLDFVVNATDGVADSATQTLSIALNGVNDTPELDAVSDGAVNDSASDDDFDDLIGTLTGRDRDDTVSFELADSTGTGEAGFNVQKSTAYGTFYLNTATGAYKFVADDAAVEALKDTVTLDFVVNATDGVADSATQTLSIALNGVNDTPELSATLTEHTYTDTAGNDSFDSVSGNLSTIDRDAGETATYAIDAAGVETGSFNVGGSTYQQKLAGSYGTLYLSSGGAYLFVPLDSAIEALEANASESFTLTVTDGSDATDSVELNINLVGAQDAPEVSPVVASYADTAGDDNFADTMGTLSVTSRDGDTGFTFALAGSGVSQLAGYDLQNTSSAYGTLYLNSTSGAYKFVANDGAIEALQWGSDPSLVYHVTASADGVTSASQTVTINITGDNDAARDIALLAVSTFANGNGTPGASTAIGTLSVPAGADPDNGGAYTFSFDSAKVGTLGSATIATDASSLFSVSSAGQLSTTAAGGLAGGSIYEVTVKVAQGTGDTLATYSETFSIVTGTNASSENLPGSGFDFGTGDDVIYGRQNIDIVYAGSGNDTVFGQGGNDEIHGGAGIDLLYGGNDNDTFVFSSGATGTTLATADTIADFSSADDTISTSLAAGNVTIANGGSLADFAAFVSAANAVLTAGAGTNDAYLAYNAAGSGNGWLVIDENDSGSLDAGDSLIVLTGVNLVGEFATTDIT